MPIREKYQTRAAAWYREELRALAEGREPPSPLPLNTGHLSTCEAASETQLMLDKVFAQAPHASRMTAGGVLLAKVGSQSPCSSPRKRCVFADLVHKQLRSTLKSCKRNLTLHISGQSKGISEISCASEAAVADQCRSRSRSPVQDDGSVSSERSPP